MKLKIHQYSENSSADPVIASSIMALTRVEVRFFCIRVHAPGHLTPFDGKTPETHTAP